jgi:hypothetical protein
MTVKLQFYQGKSLCWLFVFDETGPPATDTDLTKLKKNGFLLFGSWTTCSTTVACYWQSMVCENVKFGRAGRKQKTFGLILPTKQLWHNDEFSTYWLHYETAVTGSIISLIINFHTVCNSHPWAGMSKVSNVRCVNLWDLTLSVIQLANSILHVTALCFTKAIAFEAMGVVSEQ